MFNITIRIFVKQKKISFIFVVYKITNRRQHFGKFFFVSILIVQTFVSIAEQFSLSILHWNIVN